MTSKRLSVVQGVKSLIVMAAPAATVIGFDEDASKPEIIPAGGLILGEAGDPTEVDVTLSPPIWSYEHRIPVEVTMPPGMDDTALDAVLVPIGNGIAADPYLGGLVDYLTCTAPNITSEALTGTEAIRIAAFDIVAHYTSSNPLGG